MLYYFHLHSLHVDNSVQAIRISNKTRNKHTSSNITNHQIVVVQDHDSIITKLSKITFYYELTIMLFTLLLVIVHLSFAAEFLTIDKATKSFKYDGNTVFLNGANQVIHISLLMYIF